MSKRAQPMTSLTTVRVVQSAAANGTSSAAIATRIGISRTQVVLVLAETRALDVTVRDFLAEHDVEGSGSKSCVYDKLVAAEIARGVTPYVFDPENPVPPTPAQKQIDAWSYLARSARALDRKNTERMMRLPDREKIDEIHDLIRRAAEVLSSEGIDVDGTYLEWVVYG